MDCREINEQIEKYQTGELDYFKRKSFEKHIKNCSMCKKKYAGLLGLSMLLMASDKTAKENIAKAIAGTAVAKLIVSLLIVGAVALTTYHYKTIEHNFVNKTKQKTPKVAIIDLQNDSAELKVKDVKEDIGLTKTTTDGKLRIISSSEGRASEIIMDPKTLKMEGRKE